MTKATRETHLEKLPRTIGPNTSSLTGAKENNENRKPKSKVWFQCPSNQGREKYIIRAAEIRGPCPNLVGKPHIDLKVGGRSYGD